MKVELHCHTDRYSKCAVNTPQQIMKGLVRAGYEAVFITEHVAVWTDEELDALRKEFPKLRIFPGLEWNHPQEPLQHLVVLGTNDPAYVALPDVAEVLAKARSEGHLTVLAHPFRWEGAAEALKGEILPDAMEYRTCNNDVVAGQTAMDTARKLKLPLVCAGDTHGLKFIDRFWIETTRPLVQADDIRGIVLEGAYRNVVEMIR